MKIRTPLAAFALCAVFLLTGAVAAFAAKDYIYVPVSNSLHVIDCETDTIVETIHYNDYIVQAAHSPDGKRYYLNAWHSIYVIDTTTNKLIDTHKFSSDLSRVTVLGFAVAQDGKKLYLSCAITKKKQNVPKLNVLPPQLVVYDLEQRKMVKNYPIPYCVTGVISLRKDPDHLILFGLNIYKLNLENGKYEKVEGILDDGRNALVIWQNGSPGDHGVFANPYTTAEEIGYFLVDRNTGKLDILKGKDLWFQYSNILSPDKKYLYGVMDDLVKMDAKTGETIKAVKVAKGTCYAISMTSDGKKIYAGPAGNDLSVYDTETMELIRVIPLSADGVVAHRITK